VTAPVNPSRLAHALSIRGISTADIKAFTKLDDETIASLRAGRPVRPSTLKRLDTALHHFPVLGIVAELVDEA
jgi:hypothetical protein